MQTYAYASIRQMVSLRFIFVSLCATGVTMTVLLRYTRRRSSFVPRSKSEYFLLFSMAFFPSLCPGRSPSPSPPSTAVDARRVAVIVSAPLYFLAGIPGSCSFLSSLFLFFTVDIGDDKNTGDDLDRSVLVRVA